PTPPAPRAPDPQSTTVTLRTTAPVAHHTPELELFTTSLDADGVPSPSATVKIEATGTGNTSRLMGTALDKDTGKVTGLLRSSVAEEKTVTVTLTHEGTDVVLAMKPKVTFVPGPVQQLRFISQPSDTVAGAIMTPPVRIAVMDDKGNIVHAPPLMVNVRIVEGTAGAVLSGGGMRETVDGGLVLDMLSIDRPGFQYGMQVRQVGSPGFADDSVRFNVTAADAGSPDAG
ncbi:MAG: hypothetical protein JNK82_22070, partial [Myxococcaceae bacterium]|nr:hypothetical protein [Myxococcaceae bacterium]